ncbi:hypothetical protein ABHF33_13435 [Chitinibacter sp. FCG-7]|uniref:Uncharacterized protein n=1 Tax=Chitinibacter mangrovi TaxID=3153927 RepID=A0AAU7F8K8_9NEIS
MSNNSRLPSKSRLAVILLIGILGYAILEYSSFFLITELTKDQKALINRMGIFLGYLGTIIGGSFLFWDLLAARKEERAKTAISTLTAQIELLNTLEAEASRGFIALTARNADEVAMHQKALAEAQGYQREKGWLGWVCLAFVVASAVCQFIGASDGG